MDTNPKEHCPEGENSCRQENSFECLAAEYLKRFTRLLRVFFSLALVITVIMTLAVFFGDVANAFTTGSFTTSTIHALGSLLVLWTLSELLPAEIRHIRGEKLKVTIFIEVAIAALGRKLLIISTEGISSTKAASTWPACSSSASSTGCCSRARAHNRQPSGTY